MAKARTKRQRPEETEPVVDNDLPERIKIIDPHGFIDDEGTHRYWHAGVQVEDPEQIALLIARGATYDIMD
jgi:hypothetical protein